MSDRRCF